MHPHPPLADRRAAAQQSRARAARQRHTRAARRLRTKVPVLLLAVVAALAACDRPNRAPPRPDIVLIVIDTLRPDVLPFAGGSFGDTAPFLSGLAREGLVFRKAFASSTWTAPSTASLFTGVSPLRHGLTQGFGAQRRAGAIGVHRIGAQWPTLPELLADAGYRTFGYATNINIRDELGFRRGFQRLVEEGESHDVPDARAVAADVAAWADELAGPQPSFLYLHFMDVHAPYLERAPWYQPSGQDDPVADARARYLSELAHLDATLAELSEQIGWDADTLLWIVSDHGEEFGDHTPGQTGHTYSLHQELLSVLMMVHGPGVVAGEVTQNVGLIDVLPTLAEALELAPVEASLEGRSLWPLVTGEPADGLRAALDRRVLLSHRARREAGPGEELFGAVLGRFKLIEDDARESGAAARPGQLFDLVRDPAERHDLLADEPDAATLAVAARLSQALRDYREQRASADLQLLEADDELLEHLRQLGYAEGDDR